MGECLRPGSIYDIYMTLLQVAQGITALGISVVYVAFARFYNVDENGNECDDDNKSEQCP